MGDFVLVFDQVKRSPASIKHLHGRRSWYCGTYYVPTYIYKYHVGRYGSLVNPDLSTYISRYGFDGSKSGDDLIPFYKTVIAADRYVRGIAVSTPATVGSN